jgi:hypothetical protein
MTLRLSLTAHPRAGTLTTCGHTHALATWHNGGEGLMLATTTDGQRVTLALGDEDAEGYRAGSLCIGNGLDAPRWTLANCRSDERGTLEGMAFAVPSDGEMEKMFPGCGWGETL